MNVLRLYVLGKQRSSKRAIETLSSICENELKGDWELEVVDLLEKPQLADEDKIIAVPTLIKKLPPPVRRVVGDISDKEKVLVGLDIIPHK